MKNIYHIAILSPEHSEAVQKRLFELGCKWDFPEKQRVREHSAGVYLYLNYYGRPDRINWNGREAYKHSSSLPLTLDDLYKAQVIAEIKAPNKVSVKLNAEYTAEVSKDGIVVGCQSFPLSVLDELVGARKQVEEDEV